MERTKKKEISSFFCVKSLKNLKKDERRKKEIFFLNSKILEKKFRQTKNLRIQNLMKEEKNKLKFNLLKF